MVNYVELINHYAQPPGNGGFERYQCFRVISLLLRTPICRPSLLLLSSPRRRLWQAPRSHPSTWNVLLDQNYFSFCPSAVLSSLHVACFQGMREKCQRNACGILNQTPYSLHFQNEPAPKLWHRAKVTTKKQQGRVDWLVCQARFRRL